MRKLVMRGGPWSEHERRALLNYCAADVLALAKLLPAMEPALDLGRAVACRGRYMAAVARMEWAGVPVDMETLCRLRVGWASIQDQLIREVDSRFGVFDGRSFVAERWAGWLARGRSVAETRVRGVDAR
jgi:DNA polymerase-1